MFALAVAGLLVSVGVSPAHAGTAVVKVPVSFVVGDRVLPAGTYRIDKYSDNGYALEIANVNRRVEPVVFETDPPDLGVQPVTVVKAEFKNYRGQYFLWKLAIPEEGVREIALQPVHMDHTLAKLNLLGTEPAASAR